LIERDAATCELCEFSVTCTPFFSAMREEWACTWSVARTRY
jgi:hypothetical protein